MKMHLTKRKLVFVALAGALLLPFLVSAAARQPGGSRHGEHGFGGPPMTGPMGEMRLLRELDLSDDQRQQIRALMEELEATGVPDRLRESRKALNDAVGKGADESQLRQLAAQLGEVEGDAAVEGARIHARIQEILTPQQRTELQQLKQEAEQRMEERQKRFEERKSRKSKSGSDP